MIGRWMLGTLAFTALVCVAALAADRVLGVLRRPARMAWAFALAVCTTWPLLAPLVLDPAPPSVSMPRATATIGALTPGALGNPEPPGASLGELAKRLAVGAWIAASLLLTTQIIVALWRLRTISNSAQRVELDGERVLVTERLGPAVIGLVTPTVIVPAWLLDLDAPLRRLVLRHEREHCREHDALLVWLGVVSTTLMPWNAGLWWLSRRMRLAMEIDCDARTLAGAADMQDADDHRYAKLLLLIAQRASYVRFVPMLFGSHSQLARRISAMNRIPSRRPRLQVAGAGLLTITAVAAACSSRIASNLTSPANAGTLSASPSASASAPATAPTSTSGSALTEKPFKEFTLDSMAHLRADSPMPRYPDALRSSGRNGSLLTQFVVNADGTVDTATFKLPRGSGDPAFTAAVKAALPLLRFEPARVKGNAVRQLVELPFLFDESREAVAAQRATMPAASPRGATPTTLTQLYFDYQVENPVVMAPGSVGPKYPETLREAKVEGTVLAQFAVGIDGRAEAGSFRVLRTSDPLFGEAVREALEHMQFVPAAIGGKKVRQLVQQPFQFSLNR